MGQGSFTATNGYLETTSGGGWSDIYLETDDASSEIRCRYQLTDDSDADYRYYLGVRYVNEQNRIGVYVWRDEMKLLQDYNGVCTALDQSYTASAEDTWYNMRVTCSGSSIDVWRWADGQVMTKVLETDSASVDVDGRRSGCLAGRTRRMTLTTSCCW